MANKDRNEDQLVRDSLGFIMAYEGGEEMSEEELIEGFQMLIDTGLAWQLQGHYGRTAQALIAYGHCSLAKTQEVAS